MVLDTKTLIWYHGKEGQGPLIGAPFRHHTATLYDDYMFVAFGKCRPLKIRSENIYYISFNNFSLD